MKNTKANKKQKVLISMVLIILLLVVINISMLQIVAGHFVSNEKFIDNLSQNNHANSTFGFNTSGISNSIEPASGGVGSFGSQWVDTIGLEQALSMTQAYTDTILVGVVDTGIMSDHPSLTNQIHRTNDINTTLHRIFEFNNTDYNTGQPLLEPHATGHGTQVAGVLASMHPGIRLVSLEGCIIQSIRFATGRIPILNISGYITYRQFYGNLAGFITARDRLWNAIANFDGQ